MYKVQKQSNLLFITRTLRTHNQKRRILTKGVDNVGKQITAHFNFDEFKCPCGCGSNKTDTSFINKLENIYEYFSRCPDGVAVIIVTSGFRCSKHSVAVGGYANDAHTKGIAADIYVVKSDGKTRYNSREVAAVAEKLGFSGIGIIDNTAVHVDIRNASNYTNSHWYGNEITGDDNIKTFSEYLPKQKTTTSKHTLTVIFDDKEIIKKEFEI